MRILGDSRRQREDKEGAAARRGSRSNPGVDYISRDSTRIKLSKGCRWNVIDLIELNFKGGEKQKKTKDRDAKWPGD